MALMNKERAKGLNNLIDPWSSIIENSNIKIEITGLSSSDPGSLNQTAENKPNKRKKTKTFRVFLKKVAIDKDRTIEIDK